jgi:hypothetical protein
MLSGLLLLAVAALGQADCVPPVRIYAAPQPPPPIEAPPTPLPPVTLFRREAAPARCWSAPPPPALLFQRTPPLVELHVGTPPAVPLHRREVASPVWTSAPALPPVTLFRKFPVPARSCDSPNNLAPEGNLPADGRIH